MMVLREAVVLAAMLDILSPAYVIWLIPAPIVARWLLIELRAVSKVAIVVAAMVADEIDEVLTPKLAVPIDVITTLMV